MLCYEVWLNGEKLFVVGHKDALALDANVSFHRTSERQFLNLLAITYQEGQEARDCYWETPQVGLGDEVLIKIVESGEPKPPDYELPYGVRKPPPWGATDNFCSFCGGGDTERNMMFEGSSVKICDGCVKFYHRHVISNESPKAEPGSQPDAAQ